MEDNSFTYKNLDHYLSESLFRNPNLGEAVEVVWPAYSPGTLLELDLSPQVSISQPACLYLSPQVSISDHLFLQYLSPQVSTSAQRSLYYVSYSAAGLFINPQVSISAHRSISQPTGLYLSPQVYISVRRSLSQPTGLYLSPHVSISVRNSSHTFYLRLSFSFPICSSFFLCMDHVFFLVSQGGGQIQTSHTQILRCRLWNQLIQKLQINQVKKIAGVS